MVVCLLSLRPFHVHFGLFSQLSNSQKDLRFSLFCFKYSYCRTLQHSLNNNQLVYLSSTGIVSQSENICIWSAVKGYFQTDIWIDTVAKCTLICWECTTRYIVNPNSIGEGERGVKLTMRRKIQKKCPCLHNNNTAFKRQISLFDTALVMTTT